MAAPAIVSMSTALECVPINIANNDPAWLWGDPGIGKSEVVDQIAAAMKLQVCDWRTNLRDPVDARGLPVPDLKNFETTWLRPSDLPIKGNKKFAKAGILKLDEINTGSPAMFNVCLQLVLERRVGEHELMDGWVPVATGNPAKSRNNVQRVPTALRNRFSHYHVIPDIDALAKHAINVGIDPYLVAFLRFRKELMHRMPEDDSVMAFPTPRQWFRVNKYLGQPMAVRLHLVTALVGQDCATELEGFLRVCHELPSLQDVVADPASAKLPTQPSAKYAVAAMLARGATRKAFGNIVKYAKRLDREFEVMTVVDICRRDVQLMETPTFSQWAVDNQDVTI